MRRKGSPEEWERLRLVAANMFEQRMMPATIAKLLGVDDQTVRAWRRRYLKGGRDALASGRSTGRPVKLSGEQRQQLAQLLTAGPAACGYHEAYLWTTKLIARLIQERFGVSHHHDHVGVILHEMGWSAQLPARRAKERDEPRIAAFQDQLWPALLKKASRRAARWCSPTKSGS